MLLQRPKAGKSFRFLQFPGYTPLRIVIYTGLPIPTPLDQPGSTNGIGNGMNRKARSHGLVSAYRLLNAAVILGFLGWRNL